jgi:hypothetical protein
MPTAQVVLVALRNRLALALTLVAVAALAGPAISAATPAPSVISIRTVKVGAPGNPSVGIVPFTNAVYASCAEVVPAEKQPPCQEVGGVGYRYGIGQLEVTVAQYVAFLNTADPAGRNRHKLYSANESAAEWPKYGQIDFAPGAAGGHHYSVASPEWSDKPYGFANFLRSARFANSLYNGRLLAKQASVANGFSYVTYKVRLSRQTEQGMYDMRVRAMTRSHKRGFVIPSQNEWIKAAYYDPGGGGKYSYWQYPTNPGAFGDEGAAAPHSTTLDPTTGDVTNASTQPLAGFHAENQPAPSWCPSAFSSEECSSVNPFGMSPSTYAKAYQGSLETVGQAGTTSALGDPRPGRQRGRVDRHDHAASVRRERPPGLAAPARWHRQCPRLPALALGGRPAAPGQHLLHRHLPVARHPDRRPRRPQGGRALSIGVREGE